MTEVEFRSPHLKRDIVLANGASVPLIRAAANFGILRESLAPDHEGWSSAALLRKVCFDQPIEEEQRQTLQTQGLLNQEGEVDPVMREVVLASLRGTGKQLYLDSPFTEDWDRTLADLLNAREEIRTHLNPHQASELLMDEPVEDLINLLRHQNRVEKKSLKKIDSKEFLKRALERADREDIPLPEDWGERETKSHNDPDLQSPQR
jgi:hypothetical protein